MMDFKHKNTRIFKRNALAVSLALALSSLSQATFARYEIKLNQFFTLEVLENGEIDADSQYKASDNWNDFYTQSTVNTSDYFMNMMGTYVKSQRPVKILMVAIGDVDDNASAFSPSLNYGPYAEYTALTAGLMHNYYGTYGNEYNDPLAFVTVDRGTGNSTVSGWYEGVMHNLTYGGEEHISDLTSTLIHELSHAMGIGAFNIDNKDQDIDSGIYGHIVTTGATPSLFEQGLRDLYGNSVTAGMEIRSDRTVETDERHKYFVIQDQSIGDYLNSYNGAYFTGEHVNEVLNGALISSPSDSKYKYTVAGLPVNGLEFSYKTDEDGNTVTDASGNHILEAIVDFSHIELQNGQMSHQQYRNWNILMEAELAVLQDAGVKLDRRNMFGYSVYNSGEEGNKRKFVNNNPYFARTSDGQWLEGQSNATAYGIGLHVYGSYNDLKQQAPILSSGLYGLGIRVDGSNNDITVAKNTRVSADGEGGIGLLVSYGKEHNVSILGTVTALGLDGDAVRFDFGDNNLGNNTEYRGSYIRTEYDSTLRLPTNITLLPELDGELISDFKLAGTVVGRGSAIKIADNAYVKDIHIINGAKIFGDIVSYWDPNSSFLQYSGTDKLLTTITFGQENQDFNFSYDDNIEGDKSIVLNLASGNTTLNGSYNVRAVNIESTARLEGNGIFDLLEDNTTTYSSSNTSPITNYALSATSFNLNTTQGVFTNSGTISPGGKYSLGTISINGEYQGQDGSSLELNYNSNLTDVLKISGNTSLAGVAISLTPIKDYYASGFARSINLQDLVQVQTGSLSATSVTLNESALTLPSPTLTAVTTQTNSGASSVFNIVINRATNAYSQYATNDNARNLGQALDLASTNADLALAEVFAELDFSNADGRDISSALNHLQPLGHTSIALGMLDHQQFLNNRGRLLMQNFSKKEQGSHAYAETYAMQLHRGHGIRGVGSGKNAGVIAGIDSHNDTNIYGMYLNANYRYLGTGNLESAKDYSLYAGIKGMFSLNDEQNIKVFADLRTGFDAINYDKTLNVGNYSGKAQNDSVAIGFASALGLSKDINLKYGAISLNTFTEYSLLRTPTIDEGNAALALKLDKHIYDSLKLGLGIDYIGTKLTLDADSSYSINGSISYRHELLDDLGTVKASFKHAQNISFTQKAEFMGKDSVSASLGFSLYQGSSEFAVNAGSELFVGEGQELFGQLSYCYKF